MFELCRNATRPQSHRIPRTSQPTYQQDAFTSFVAVRGCVVCFITLMVATAYEVAA